MIACAAVKITCTDGEHIIPCHRHCNAFYIIGEFGIQRDKKKDVQGFLNEHGEFLDRKAALAHAKECGQIKESKFEDLYSEDLW